MASLLQDLRLAFRQLARSPGFATTAILTLALGIGATTAIYSVVHTVVLRPLALPDPDRLVVIWSVPDRSSGGEGMVSNPDFADWRSQTGDRFEGMAAFKDWSPTLTGAGGAEQVVGQEVSHDFFSVVGVEPALGRDFSAEEDTPGRGAVVILSHDLWRNRFGADRALLGRAIMVGGAPHTVIGVLPASFRFPLSPNAQIWRPVANNVAKLDERGNHFIRVVGRLRHGVTLATAQQQMRTVAARLAAQYPESDAGRGARVVSLHRQITGPVRRGLFVLLGAAAMVLLVACANLANLLLAKGTGRAPEFALRRALGASRGRLMSQLLSETTLLALIGGTLGFVLSIWLVDLLVAVSPPGVPRLADVTVDRSVLLFAIATTMVTGVLFGVAPAWQASSFDLSGALRERGGPPQGRVRLRGALVMGEIALALLLLIGASLLGRSLGNLTRVRPGFEPTGLLTAEVLLDAKYATPARGAAFFSSLWPRLRALPGVVSAAGAFGTPLSDNTLGIDFAIDGRPAAAPGEEPSARVDVVSPDYFTTLGIPLRAGRAINDQDAANGPGVAVVNEAFVHRYFAGQDPIGQRVRLMGSVTPEPDRVRTLVGVVGDVKDDGPAGVVTPEMYIPYVQFPLGRVTLTVRTAGDPATLVKPIRALLTSLDPDLPLANVHPMDELIDQTVAQPRFYALLTGGFALAALVLALVGVYGVMAYTVARRARELGIRIALGARAPDVFRLVLGQSARLTLWGGVLGLVGAAAVMRLLSSLLFGVDAYDPTTYLVSCLALIGAAFLASYVPARQATRVDPMVALRTE